MLEVFEKIYCTKAKANNEELEKLYRWLKSNSFPKYSLPQDYLDLMYESNGGDYVYGEREYQFLTFEEVAEYYEAYMFSEFMPYAFPFAMDGCGNFYIFNLRTEDGCVYTVSAGNMGWEKDECYRIAGSFRECLAQKKLWDEYIELI